ncbi:hypothetical protein IWW38_001410, partial [Coemansia aciculifera]
MGPVLFAADADVSLEAQDVGLTLHLLWFLLTRPAKKLGLLTSSTHKFECLSVNASLGSTTLDVVGFSNIFVTDNIKQREPIVGRLARLYKVQYGKRVAVLKLAWTRTNRLPEGAVYEVLATKDDKGNPLVSGIPTVYASGILAKNVDGYRLEFSLMEDCGESIVSYFRNLRKENALNNTVAPAVKRCVESVMQTLAEARHVSILHRDISAGNIAIKNGRAYVIDWGYAKLLYPPNERLTTVTTELLKEGNPGREEFIERWGLDWGEVMDTEKAKDPFTGTSWYMSIQVLFQVRDRGIFNDIESLFYVILDALSDR